MRRINPSSSVPGPACHPTAKGDDGAIYGTVDLVIPHQLHPHLFHFGRPADRGIPCDDSKGAPKALVELHDIGGRSISLDPIPQHGFPF
jgi:hypothetical protein